MLQLVRAGARAWLRPAGCQGLSSLAEEAARPTENPEQVAVASEGLPEPVLRKVELPVPAHRRPVQAWVESLRGFEQERVGLADLHPMFRHRAQAGHPAPGCHVAEELQED